MSKASNPFVGRWRIILMGAWDQSYVDEEGEGYFKFTSKDLGKFHFCFVRGEMDCRRTTKDGESVIEWTWDGDDEMHAAMGRGWAVLKGEELHGKIYFHFGEESEFVAKKTPPGKSKQK